MVRLVKCYSIYFKRGLKENEITFEINPKGWLDPYKIYFELTVENNNDYPIQLDDSAHSLISRMSILINGVEVETIDNYPMMMKLFFQMTLTNKQRANKAEHEGFGSVDNHYDGDIIPNDTTNIYNNILNLSNKKDSKEQKDLKEQKDNKTVISKDDPNIDNIMYQYETSIIKPQLLEKAKENITKLKNQKTYYLPLMSVFFGRRMEEKNWRLMTYRNMRMQIKIKLNHYGVFYNFKDVNINSTTLKNIQRPSSIKIKNPKICYTEHTFTDTFDKELYAQAVKEKMIYDYIDYVLFDKFILNNEDTIEQTIKLVLKKSYQGVRALILLTHDNFFKVSGYGRELAQTNLGFSKFQIGTEHGYWPNDKYYDEFEMLNSSNECKKNNKLLYDNIIQLQRFKDNSESIFTKGNLARKDDISSLAAKVVNSTQTNLVKILQDDKSKTLGSCKNFHMLKFDNVPYKSDNIIGGITLEGMKTILLTLKRNESAINKNGYEYLKSLETTELKGIYSNMTNLIVETSKLTYRTLNIIGQIYKRSQMDVYANITNVGL